MDFEPVDEDAESQQGELEVQGNCKACSGCQKFHLTVSKWMLPEHSRDIYLERANCIPPPIFIILISIAEVAVFIYYAYWMTDKQLMTLDEGIWNSPFTYRPDKRQEAWRFTSYMLVHAGVQHILGNVFLQLLLGIQLELVHKGLRVGLVYIAGVIAGSLASSIFDPLIALVGASGGVYALIGGYFMNVIVNFDKMIPLFGVFRLLSIVAIVGTDVGFALYRRFLSNAVGHSLGSLTRIFSSFPGVK
ncbi:rhomboid-related protein 2-like isoform X2 [Acipenser ruthenus]|uniref:rhomboid-related protein 2-like isoform X2 n=1 Tax=Acipenser ruthenus TaxID=7906 RepID=UPI0027420344|nr:rhomboid-related protein 2-like isoform X2 [Acipenser ruthenus]